VEPVQLDAHSERVLALASPLEVVHLSIRSATGCALAEDAVASLDLPRFDNSAMDGYAVRVADAAAGQPLRVVGDGAAGSGLPPALPPGHAARIMTGAPVPADADAVVPVELTDRGDPEVSVPQNVRPGSNIRRAAEDLAAGAVAAHAGEPLTAGRIALLASLGFASVAVRRRPVVSVLATGSELTTPGQPLPPAGIYESNATMLAALVSHDGADVRVLPHVRDDPREALDVVRRAADDSDLVITAGGISAGDFEVIRQALGATGTVEFGPVTISPGRPQGWGRVNATPVVCLPGNPVSALVSYLLFAAPVIRRLLGYADPLPQWLRGSAAEALSGRTGRTQLLLGVTEATGVRAAGHGHLLTALARATCLLRLDPEASYAIGDPVPLLVL
jgi:molybdopterin molybdotransferase